MDEVLVLHFVIIIVACCFAQLGVRTGRTGNARIRVNYGIIISFVILLVFLGLRESLGKDLVNYEKIYSSPLQQEFSFGESREIGFLFLIKVLNFLDFDFQSFVFVTSFIMLLLLYTSYRKFFYILPFGLLVYFVDWGYPVTINTVRQGIALMAFLNASLYINSNERFAFLKFLSFVIIGCLFHYSILAFIPCYFIGRLKLKMIYFLFLCLIIFIISFFLISNIFEDTLSVVEKYEKYVNDPSRFEEEHTFGFGATLVLLLRLSPILIYNHIKRNFPSFLSFFVLYFIGLSIYYGFFYLLLVTRFTFYLQFFELFTIAFFLHFLLKKRRPIWFKLCGVTYISLLVFVYVYKFRDFLLDQVTSSHFSLMFIDFSMRDL